MDLLHQQNSEVLNQKIVTVNKLTKENELLHNQISDLKNSIEMLNSQQKMKDKINSEQVVLFY